MTEVILKKRKREEESEEYPKKRRKVEYPHIVERVPSINLCITCNEDIGWCNPRQLCRKTFCENPNTEFVYYVSEKWAKEKFADLDIIDNLGEVQVMVDRFPSSNRCSECEIELSFFHPPTKKLLCQVHYCGHPRQKFVYYIKLSVIVEKYGAGAVYEGEERRWEDE